MVAKITDKLLHCWIDRLDFKINKSRSFSMCNWNSIIKSLAIKLGENEYTFNVIWERVSTYFTWKLSLKFNYRLKDYLFAEILFLNWIINKVCIHGKAWKLASLSDVWFNAEDILDWARSEFVIKELSKIDLCADFQIDEDNLKQWFLDNLYESINKSWKCSRFTEKEGYESVNIWIRDKKDNKDFYFRVYDKQKEIIANKTKSLYLDYVDNPYKIIRFEMELRSNIANNINIKELYSQEIIYNYIATYFWRKHCDYFQNIWINFEKKLIKRKHDNSLWGSAVARLDKLKFTTQIKSLRTQTAKLENDTGLSIDKLMAVVNPDLWIVENYSKYILTFRWIFSTIRYVFESWDKVKYRELHDIIKNYLLYISSFYEITPEEYLWYVRWWINKELESFVSENEDAFLYLIHIYYWNNSIKSDDLHWFLDILSENNLNERFWYLYDKDYFERKISKIERKITIINEDQVSEWLLLDIVKDIYHK